MTERGRSIVMTLVLSTGAGAVASAAIETALTILRRAGHRPYPNLSNQPSLVMGVFLLCGGLLGFWLGARELHRGRAGWTVAVSLFGASVGVAAAVILWALIEGMLTGSETGMHLLSIPFLWERGLIPFLMGMGLGWWASARRSASTRSRTVS